MLSPLIHSYGHGRSLRTPRRSWRRLRDAVRYRWGVWTREERQGALIALVVVVIALVVAILIHTGAGVVE